MIFSAIFFSNLFLQFLSLLFQTELKQNISVLEEKDKALDKALENLEKVDTIDVDEAVTTTAPLYRQYVDAQIMCIFLHIAKLIYLI